MANFNYNSIQLGGRLTADPELKTTASGTSVVSFTVAINRRGKNGDQPQSDFFRCIAFEKTGEYITQFFRKGSSIFVTGRLQNNNWTDQAGVKHYGNDVIVTAFEIVDSKADSQPQSQQTAYVPSSYTKAPDIEQVANIPNDGELPF